MGSTKGQSSTSSNSTYSPPPEVMAQYKAVTNQADQVAATPYQPYGGQLVSPVNGQQYQGINAVNANAGVQNPYNFGAAAATVSGAQNIDPTMYSADQVNQYLSPYLNDVAGSTVAQLGNLNAQQSTSLTGNAISSGAFGGDRAGVAQAQLAGQQDLNEAPTIANIYNTGFNQAQGEFNTQQATDLSASQNSAARQLQAGAQLGQLGQTAQTEGLTQANAETAAGTLEQQTQQAQDTAAYNQFIQQQSYPFQTTGWLANIVEGIGSQSGGTSTGTSNTTSSSLTLHRGGRVRRANGGVTPRLNAIGMPESDVIGFDRGGGVIPHFDLGGGAGGIVPYENDNSSGGIYGTLGGGNIVTSANLPIGHTIPNAPAPPAQTSQSQPNYAQQNQQAINGFNNFAQSPMGQSIGTGISSMFSAAPTALAGATAPMAAGADATLASSALADPLTSLLLFKRGGGVRPHYDDGGGVTPNIFTDPDSPYYQPPAAPEMANANPTSSGYTQPMTATEAVTPQVIQSTTGDKAVALPADSVTRSSLGYLDNPDLQGVGNEQTIPPTPAPAQPKTGVGTIYGSGSAFDQTLQPGSQTANSPAAAPVQAAAPKGVSPGGGPWAMAADGTPVATDTRGNAVPTPAGVSPAAPPAPPQGGIHAPTAAPVPGGPTQLGAPLTVQNSNPGALVDNAWTRTLPGYVGANHGLAVFDTPAHGWAAMDQNIQSYGAKGLNTPAQIAATWAPKDDGKDPMLKGNDPASYATKIASDLGVGVNDKINLSDPNVRAKLAQSMAGVEGGPGAGAALAQNSAATPLGLTKQGVSQGVSPADVPAPGVTPAQQAGAPGAPQPQGGGNFLDDLMGPKGVGSLFQNGTQGQNLLTGLVGAGLGAVLHRGNPVMGALMGLQGSRDILKGQADLQSSAAGTNLTQMQALGAMTDYQIKQIQLGQMEKILNQHAKAQTDTAAANEPAPGATPASSPGIPGTPGAPSPAAAPAAPAATPGAASPVPAAGGAGATPAAPQQVPYAPGWDPEELAQTADMAASSMTPQLGPMAENARARLAQMDSTHQYLGADGQYHYLPGYLKGEADKAAAVTRANMGPEVEKAQAEKDLEQSSSTLDSTNASIYRLQSMKAQAESLPKTGLLSQGAFANERLGFAKDVQGVVQALGGSLDEQTVSHIASLEDMSKDSFRLGAELSRTLGAREAAQIVQQSVAANPSAGNTAMGFKRVWGGLTQALLNQRDQANFIQQWAGDHGGSTLGAKVAFQNANPPSKYVERAITSTVDPRDAAQFQRDVKIPDAANAIDGKYGVGTAKLLIKNGFDVSDGLQ